MWIGFLFVVLLPVALLLAPLERRARSSNLPIPAAARQIVGAALVCLGIALLAMYGFGDSPLAHLDIAAFLMVLAGAGMSGLVPLNRKRG